MSSGARIPRDEVEEMGRVVMCELDELQPGCTSTIAGGWDSFAMNGQVYHADLFWPLGFEGVNPRATMWTS